ncbi:MAG: hypothetical protein ACI9B9_001488 [Halioglobus sp.]|jgi:hypothetical protein
MVLLRITVNKKIVSRSTAIKAYTELGTLCAGGNHFVLDSATETHFLDTLSPAIALTALNSNQSRTQ